MCKLFAYVWNGGGSGGTRRLAAGYQDEIVDVRPPEAPTYDYPPAAPDEGAVVSLPV